MNVDTLDQHMATMRTAHMSTNISFRVIETLGSAADHQSEINGFFADHAITDEEIIKIDSNVTPVVYNYPSQGVVNIPDSVRTSQYVTCISYRV